MIERQQMMTRQLSSGDCLTIPVYHFRGSDPDAPSLYLQSTIHGAETQGYCVALKLMEHFSRQPPAGDITLVPLANPYGVNSKMGEATFGRFDPVSGDNWNRHYADLAAVLPYDDFIRQQTERHFIGWVPAFKQLLQTTLTQSLQPPQFYGKKLNLQLQSLACQADIVLDLHCDTRSQPHVYAPDYALDNAVKLNMPYVIAIPPQFSGALDESIVCPWWTLMQRLNQQNSEWATRPPVEAFTVELGHQHLIDQAAAQHHAAELLAYLAGRGVCQAEPVTACEVTTAALENFITLYAPTGGLVINVVPLGQKVDAHTSLMAISNPGTVAQLDSLTHCSETGCHQLSYPHPCIPITHIDSSNVHEGMAVMKLIRL